jgi:hypothetical protein
MRNELSQLWALGQFRRPVPEQLREWCQRAEASGIAPLQKFSSEIAPFA